MLGLFTVKALPAAPPSPCQAACMKKSRPLSHSCHEKYFPTSAYTECMRPIWRAESECFGKCKIQQRLERETRLNQTTTN